MAQFTNKQRVEMAKAKAAAEDSAKEIQDQRAYQNSYRDYIREALDKIKAKDNA